MAPSNEDLERGLGPTNQSSIPTLADDGPSSSIGDRRQSGNDLAGISDTVKTHLSEFRFHLGIHKVTDLVDTDRRPAPNMGIYQRTITAEQQYEKEYKVFALLINGALGLQIIIAAALTALGAGNGPRSAVTVFGAMNTIIAGFLTFLKGSGLPNRLKYYHNEWAKVREYIEQRERDFACGHLDDSAFKEEVATIERMYENVRRDIEMNTPDSYISMSQAGRHQLSVEPHPSLARGLEAARRKLEKTEHDMSDFGKRRLEITEHDIDEKVKTTEDKLLAVAERAAEKVLHMTQRK